MNSDKVAVAGLQYLPTFALDFLMAVNTGNDVIISPTSPYCQERLGFPSLPLDPLFV